MVKPCNYERLKSDYLNMKNEKEKKQIRDKFIECLYELINRWIGAVILYNDFQNHYNEVFEYVYKKIFGKEFDRIIRKYRPSEGSFEKYLKTIIIRKVIDLVRKNPELKNEKIFSSKDIEIVLDRNEIEEKLILTLGLEQDRKSKKELADIIDDCLALNLRVVFKLKFIAYASSLSFLALTGKELEYISNQSGFTFDEVERKIKDIQREMKKELEKQEHDHNRYEIYQYKYELQMKKIAGLREQLLFEIRQQKLDELEKEASNTTQKQYLKKIEELKKKKISTDLCLRKAVYGMEFRKMLEYEKKRDTAKQKSLRAIKTPSKMIADVLNISPGSVDLRFTRAINLLRNSI